MRVCNFGFYSLSQIRVLQCCFFQSLVTLTPCTFQGVVKKGYARRRLGMCCRFPIKITNLNPLYARILCAKFAQLFLSRRFLKVVKVFSLCGHYLFNNTLCQVCLKSAQRFWRRIFLKVVDIFSPSRCDLPLGKKKQGYLFEQI